MSERSPQNPADCYAAIVSALRHPDRLRSLHDSQVQPTDSVDLVAALPTPGRESEEDRVLTFVEVICGWLEYWYWCSGSDGIALSVFAKEGLEPYGGLDDFAFFLARQSELAAVSMHGRT